MKILKSTVTKKKVIVCEKKLAKVAAFVIFPTFIMVLFEIMPISTNRPGHCATDVSGWGPNEFFIKSEKK